MTRRRVSAPSPAAPAALLGDIRVLIEAARQRAASAVNSELTMLYWSIPELIDALRPQCEPPTRVSTLINHL
jgi:hypothetical protein